MINLINDSPDSESFLYITPYLREVNRIKGECKQKHFYEPDTQYGHGSKYRDLQKMLSDGRNIVSTHALFMKFNETVEAIISAKGYSLALDESFSPLTTRNIKKDDFDMLKRDGNIEVDLRGFIHWLKPTYDGVWDWMKYYADKNCLMLSGNGDSLDKSVIVTVWLFPIDVLRAFKQIYVMTYKFGGSLLYSYLKMHGMDYELMSMDDSYNIVPYDINIEIVDRKRASKLINICTSDNLNAIGDSYYALSKSWFSKRENQPLVEILKGNLYNWYRNVVHTKSDEALWTTFSAYKHAIQGKGFTKGFIECNARAVNEYRQRSKLAYCLNRFEVPTYVNLFQHNGIIVNEDELGLSDLIQWVWRGAIREGNPIELYLPSSRMRGLLTSWLQT